MIDLLILTAIVTEYGTVSRQFRATRRRSGQSSGALGELGTAFDAVVRPFVGSSFEYRTHAAEIDERTVGVVQMGIGPSRARRATTWAIERFKPHHVLVLGVAGGLAPDLAIGDVVSAESVVTATGERESVTALPYLTLPELLANAPWTHRTGTIAQSPHIVGTPDEKRDFYDRSKAIAVDMESHAVAQICNRSSIPVSVIRVISDSAAYALPPEIGKLMDESGNPRAMRAIGQIVRRPGLLRELLAMEKGNKVAVARLKELSARIRASMASSL